MRSNKLSAALLGLFLLGGCFKDNSPTASGEDDTKTTFAVAKSAAERVTAQPGRAVMDEQAASINAFAVAMYKLLGEQEGGNIFFSPYSITAALGMTEAGARGATAEQIRQALSVTLEGDNFHAAVNALDLSLMGHAGGTEGVTLNVVNSTWAQSGWDFRVAYLDLLARYYGAGVNLLDFIKEPEPCRVTINTWVEEQTRQKIKDLIPRGSITSDTRLVLTNAIYFLADWLVQFDASLTQDEAFTRIDNSTVQAPLMQLGEDGKEVKMVYYQEEGVRAIDLPYKGGRLCMTALLPDKGSFGKFEKALTAARISEMVGAMDSVEIPPVRFPRFTFKTGSISLVSALNSLGMKDAFSGAADFSGIDGRKDLFVSDVIHKAFVAVDEKGTEAAAATAVIIKLTSIPVNPPQFIADRPFIYVIRDRQTGVILFMGRVLDPTVEE